MYESPIMLFQKVQDSFTEQFENQVMATLKTEYAIDVNKDELLRMMAYDRDQYNQGYRDARAFYERPKGRWLMGEDTNEYICSECGQPTGMFWDAFGHGFVFARSPHCPKCGCQMEEYDTEEFES